MRSLLAAAVLVLSLPASAAIVSTPGTNIRSQRDILGCADVRAFGAVGNGVADDTAAIQAAVNSFPAPGGPVCLPPGTYKISSTITLQKSSSILGASISSSDSIGNPANQTVIDATSILAAVAIQGPSNSSGITLKGFRLNGPKLGGSTNPASEGISTGSFAAWFRCESVYVEGFMTGYRLENTLYAMMLGCRANEPVARGLLINGGSTGMVLGGIYQNAAGWWAANNGGIFILGGARDFTISVPEQDESFYVAGRTTGSLVVLSADRIHISGMRVYYTHNGYGIRLGDGTNNPTNVTLRDVRIERFSAGGPPIAGLEIRGSGHLLDNVGVFVDPDGGNTAISDLATDTRYRSVTSSSTAGSRYIAFKDPSVRRTYPGSGTNEAWIDPSDALSTTYLRFAR